MLGISYCFLNGRGTSFNVLIYGKFKFNFLSRAQLEPLSLDYLFFILYLKCHYAMRFSRLLYFCHFCSRVERKSSFIFCLVHLFTTLFQCKSEK